MKALNPLVACFGSVLLLGAFATACGGGGQTSTGSGGSTTGTGGSGGSGGMTTTTSSSSSSSSSGTGGTGTGGTGTGGTGTGGGTVGTHGPPASQLVNGGDVVKSPGYKMVFTLGQPTQNQTKTTSPGYRMQGGIIGATGTLP